MTTNQFEIVRARRFSKLDDAISWTNTVGRRQGNVRQSFIVVREESLNNNYTKMYFEAIEVGELAKRTRKLAKVPDARRHYHEVIVCGWPVKAYVDLDGKTSNINDFERYVDDFKRRFEAAARMHLHASTISLCELDASDSTKCSRHLVWSMLDEFGRTMAFPNAETCGHFMSTFVVRPNDDPPFFDAAVYSKNHTLRMYGSSKLDAAHPRPFVERTTRSCFDVDVLMRSLITQPLDAAIEIDYAFANFRTASLSSITRPHVDVIDVRDLYAAVNTIADVSQWGGAVSVKCSQGVIFVGVRERPVCVLKQDVHSQATTYYLIDVTKRRYRQACHASTCAGRRAPWVPLTDESSRLLAATTIVDDERPASAPPSFSRQEIKNCLFF